MDAYPYNTPITAARELLLHHGLLLEACCKTEPVQKQLFAPCYTQPKGCSSTSLVQPSHSSSAEPGKGLRVPEHPQSGGGWLFSSISEWTMLMESFSAFPCNSPVPVNADLGDLGKRVKMLPLQLLLSWGTNSPLTHVPVFQGIMLAGDGYRGKTSPHTPNERFEGATVLKALKVQLPPPPPLPCPPSQMVHSADLLLLLLLAQYGYEGRVPLKSARLFYDISEKARRIVESYFMLNSTLYFSYTHLVCRTALSGEGSGGRRRGMA